MASDLKKVDKVMPGMVLIAPTSFFHLQKNENNTQLNKTYNEYIL